MNLIIVNSHPIQYFAPLYRRLTEANVNLQVYYCSDESIKGMVDRQFGVSVRWDIPLLEGYKYDFLPNLSLTPSISRGFWGIINPRIIFFLWKNPKSYVVVHGWQYLTYILVIVFASLMGHQVCLRTETPLSQELEKKNIKTRLRKYFMRHFIFPLTHKFLYIGEQNRKFYEYYGVSQDRLVFTPYAIDNERFQIAFQTYKNQRENIRAELGLPLAKVIILVSGKYIQKKRPLDILKAYQLIDSKDTALVMVGDGELRSEIEAYIKDNSLQNVYLTGFVNQSKIPFYYLIADIFVMYSGVGETWGLSVNEAMNFELPIIVSSITGCASDLVKDQDNGYVVDDWHGLAEKISLLSNDYELRKKMGTRSGEIIQTYSYQTIVDNLKDQLVL